MGSTRSERPAPLSRELLLGYFLRGATPRTDWKVGMELEKMGRDARTGRPIPYRDGSGPTVLAVLEFFRRRRRADPILEGENLIGLEGPWGNITLEPGGQVEWSSTPQGTLAELENVLTEHLALMREAAETLGIEWLDLALDPVHAVDDMPWMPKSRYDIMRSYLGARGRLAHRMMTQTASIQCAFDFADPEDWKRKFRAAALLAPVATALFANSSRIDGSESGYRNYRQMIWRETDPDRCGLPAIVFEAGFDIERWLDYVLDVPTFFLRRPEGLVPSGGTPFSRLMDGGADRELETDDWATHVSTIFTEVRSYTYIEVRSADLQRDDLALAVPTFWTGTLYDEDALGEALEFGADLDYAGWDAAMLSAAREGLDGRIGRFDIREAARRAIAASARGLRAGAPCTGDPESAVAPLERLCVEIGLDPPF